MIIRLTLLVALGTTVGCSRYEPEDGGGGGGGGGAGGGDGGGGGELECTAPGDCGCHETCDAAGQCVALGAPSPALAANAHGNWAGTPGEDSYVYQNTCATNDECAFGEICSVFTGSCVNAASLLSCSLTEKCGVGFVCDLENQKCVPPALCNATRNCCGIEGYSCQGAAGADPGFCFAPQCTPPETVTSECPFAPQLAGECPSGNFCSPDGQCVQCVCDDDCPSGQKCDATASCVVQTYCEALEDCADGMACDLSTNQCVDRCDSDLECGGGNFCNPQHVCRCVGDSNEANDYPEEATPIDVPAYGFTTVIDGALCVEEFDADWFSLELLRGDRIEVWGSSPTASNAQLFAFGPPDASIELSRAFSLSAGLEFTADQDDVYWVTLQYSNSLEYTLNFRRSAGTPCDAGGYNDAATAATPIGINGGILPEGCTSTFPTIEPEVIACTDLMNICERTTPDEDFYVVDLEPNTEMSVLLSDFPGANLNMDLYGPFAVGETFTTDRLLERADGTSLTETVATYSRDGGQYYILVKGHQGSVSTYHLQLTLNYDACLDDAYDAVTATPPAFDSSGTNDDAASAAGLDVGLSGETVVPLAVCPGDRDWFQIGYDVGGNLEPLPVLHRVGLTLSNADPGPLTDLLLFAGRDAAQVAAAAASQTSRTQTINLTTQGGPYYVVVAPSLGNPHLFSDYELTVSVEPPPACDLDDLGDADPANRNDLPAAAYVLNTPPWPNAVDDPAYTYPFDATGLLSLCAFDHDWYRIDMAANSAVVASINYDSAQAEAGLALYDYRVTDVLDFDPGVAPTLGRLANQALTGTGQQTVQGEPSLGPAFILVYNRSGWPLTDYSLTVDFIPEGCTEDGLEPNDDAANATPIQVTASATLPGVEDALFPNLAICEDSDDWFDLDLGPGDRIRVNVTYQPAQGNLDLKLFGPGSTSTPLASAFDSGNTGLLAIDYTLPTNIIPAVHRLQILAAGTAAHENAYDLEVLVNRSCLDDRYSPATFESPYPIDLSSEPLVDGNMQLCDTEDWLAISSPSGGDVSICIRFVHADIDLDLELYDLLGDPTTTVPMADSLTKRNWEEIIFSAAPGVTYWSRVFPDFRSVGTTQYATWVRPDANGCVDTCVDGVVNGDETDVDCGGGTCATCDPGFACDVGSDCASGICNGSICN